MNEWCVKNVTWFRFAMSLGFLSPWLSVSIKLLFEMPVSGTIKIITTIVASGT